MFRRLFALHGDASAPVFLVLLNDESRARMSAEVLADALGGTVLVPPERGLAFFAAAASQELLDRWWAGAVPPDSQPVYLIEHQEGLLDWIRGIDGCFLIEVRSSIDALRYDALGSAFAVLCDSEMDLVYEAVHRFGKPPVAPAAGEHAVGSTMRDSAASHAAAPSDRIPPADPFDLLAAMLNDREPPRGLESHRVEPPLLPPVRGAARAPGQPAALWARLRRPRAHEAGRVRSPGNSGAELAHRILDEGPIVVAVGSRKGGVGKTSHAAGIAIVAGEALDAVGRRAAIVDANLANPDAWGQLNLPAAAATVRQAVAALSRGVDPPLPVHATTPALACYPEDREGSEYSRTDIRRFAAFLRTSYSFTIIDLSNRLPDVAGGAEAAAAAFWVDEADVLLLPTGPSKQEFNGVLDFLEVPGLPPAVVAYINPRSRRNREHPLTKRYLHAIAQRVHAVVPLPDDADRVRYAVMEGLPVQAVSPGLRVAYRRLAEAVTDAARVRVA